MTQPVSDLVCLSHLRWNFVYQRPNHLMARAARGRRVFFIEEPEFNGAAPRLDLTHVDGVTVVRPILPDASDAETADLTLRQLVDELFARERVHAPWLWYYTPMALGWTTHVPASAVVYDCMDELSNFKLAPAQLREREAQLMAHADVVFTGGRSLFEAKKDGHARTFCFPSSVDIAHFAKAREDLAQPADQACIARPRIGFYGVIDERIDLALIDQVAAARPDWHLVMLGPLAKIHPEDLPQAANIHWLGMKSYDELPAYLSGWDVAMMPFAINDSTRFISPTKTPEYLAGGVPVVSTPITDVAHPYGDEGLVHIGADAPEFIAAVELALRDDRADLMKHADAFLAAQSWDATWAGMENLIEEFRPQQPIAAQSGDARPVGPGRAQRGAPTAVRNRAGAQPNPARSRAR